MYYITNHEDKILNDLAKLEKEFDRVDKMIADLYTLIGVHANGHYVLLTKQEAAEEVGVSVRQFERLIYDWHLDKVETPTGDIRYRRSQVLEIKTGRGGHDLQELRKIIMRRKVKVGKQYRNSYKKW